MALPPAILVAIASAALLLGAPGARPSALAPPGPIAARAVAAIAQPPAYYRPPVIGGMAFPLARSTYLSLVQILVDWHEARIRLVNGSWQLVGVHEGIDIMAERGTPIVSMTAGIVENVGWTFYSGNRIGVRGVDGRYYFYAHLSSYDPAVVLGARVEPGQVLGNVGNTGYGAPGERDQFPAHLHFGIQDGSEWIDPHATLVRLYRATVAATQREQRTLDRLAASADLTGYRREAARTLLSLPPADGE